MKTRLITFCASFFMVVLWMAIAGCQTVPLKVAAPRPAESNDFVGSRLRKGRSVYVSLFKCARCHRPKPVYDYSPETWVEDILPRMATKAGLHPEDYQAVKDYVVSEDAQARPAGSQLD